MVQEGWNHSLSSVTSTRCQILKGLRIETQFLKFLDMKTDVMGATWVACGLNPSTPFSTNMLDPGTIVHLNHRISTSFVLVWVSLTLFNCGQPTEAGH